MIGKEVSVLSNHSFLVLSLLPGPCIALLSVHSRLRLPMYTSESSFRQILAWRQLMPWD